MLHTTTSGIVQLHPCANCSEPYGMDMLKMDGLIYCPSCYISTVRTMRRMGAKVGLDVMDWNLLRSQDESKS